MPCYHPIPAAQDTPGSKVTLYPKDRGTGDNSVVNLKLSCGQCVGCRSARATAWARRCVHEASCHARNSFVTLTYSDEFVPFDGSLEPDVFTRFIKRLRKRVPALRYFACGEYGSLRCRPHYHALLFNCGFDDTRRVGDVLYESDLLSSVWGYGDCRIGEVTGASANYIAKYSLKSLGTDFGGAVPPFLRMSLKPAIGYSWLARFSSDLKNGYLVADGRKCPIPRSYMQRLVKDDADVSAEFARLSSDRRALLVKSNGTVGDHNDRARLDASEVIHERRLALAESHSF